MMDTMKKQIDGDEKLVLPTEGETKEQDAKLLREQSDIEDNFASYDSIDEYLASTNPDGKVKV